MRPSTLWRHRRPVLRWSLFLLALAAVGTGLYITLPPEPRWERAEGRSVVYHVGGDRIAIFPEGEGTGAGPVQLFDAGTGAEIARFLSEAPAFHTRAYSEDGRYFVALVQRGQANTWHVLGVDLHEHREWHADVRAEPCQPVFFSPGCDFVALHLDDKDNTEQSYAVHDTRNGRQVARVHMPALAHETAFSRDSSAFIVHYQDQEKGRHICAVNTRTGKAMAFHGGELLSVAPDGRCLIADRGEDGIWVGDLADGSWRCCLNGARFRYPGELQDRLFLRQYPAIAFFEHRHSGTKRTRFGRFRRDLGASDGNERGIGIVFKHGDILFSPDAQHVLWRASANVSAAPSVCYDVHTGEVLWRQTWPAMPAETAFMPDSGHIVVRLAQTANAEVLDAATGATARTIPMPGLADQSAVLRCDGRTLTAAVTLSEAEPFWLWAKVRAWLPDPTEPAPMMQVRFFDFATGEPFGEVTCDDTGEWWLTADRQGLITVYDDTDESGVTGTVIQCWDIPPHKPLRWIVGVPLALGCVLLSIRHGWRRLRGRCKPVTAVPGAPSCA